MYDRGTDAHNKKDNIPNIKTQANQYDSIADQPLIIEKSENYPIPIWNSSFFSEREISSVSSEINNSSFSSEREKSSFSSVINNSSFSSEREKSSVSSEINNSSFSPEREKSSISSEINNSSFPSEICESINQKEAEKTPYDFMFPIPTRSIYSKYFTENLSLDDSYSDELQNDEKINEKIELNEEKFNKYDILKDISDAEIEKMVIDCLNIRNNSPIPTDEEFKPIISKFLNGFKPSVLGCKNVSERTLDILKDQEETPDPDISDISSIAWTYIVDPFCAITSVCSILLNCESFINYISNLNDSFSLFAKQSIMDTNIPFDLLSIPQVLWDSDPIEIINKIMLSYSKIPNFDLFEIIASKGGIEHCLFNVCVDIKASFQESIKSIQFISPPPILTISFGRYFGDQFVDTKFPIPLTYRFSEDNLNLLGFIYVIHPLTSVSHYISVIRKNSKFYECNGKPNEIIDINYFMMRCNIVACFYIKPDFNHAFIPPIDFDKDILFKLEGFKFFKFHSNNPFLSLHEEYNSPEFIQEFDNFENILKGESQGDISFVPSDEDPSSETLDFKGDDENVILSENEDCTCTFSDEQIDDVSPGEFFSTNRFLYDALMHLEIPSIKNVSNLLEMTIRKLRDNLIQNKMTTNMKDLKELAKSVELNDPPPVYHFLSELMQSEGAMADLKYIEFIIPQSEYHFDYYNLLFNRSTFPAALKNGIPRNFDFSEIKPDIDHYFNVDKYLDNPENSCEYIEFRQKLKKMYDELPNLFKNLDGDQRFLINSHISIAFLYGNVEISKGGIGSPHLKGTFSMSARKQGTGYLNLDSVLNSTKHVDNDKLREIIEWLKLNNPLYAEIAPLNVEFYQSRIEPNFATKSEIIGLARLPNSSEMCSTQKDTDFNKIPISMPDSNGNKVFKYLFLEEALSLCFPMIFPNGVIPLIPGKTLKEKASNLLSAHEFYRCGRLQCSMILFLYNAISSHNASYIQNRITVQKTTIPNGASRNIPANLMLFNDPSMPEYWINRQAQVRAMCSELGDPDLMITFTFVNKWPEVKRCEDLINDHGFDKVDIRFCPFEEMMIWNNRFYDIKKNGFNDLIKYMNFGEVSNFCWRLEFQARGAPHVHALLWLENRLSLNTISQNFFAHFPDELTSRLNGLVTNNMIHNCITSRCKGGIESAQCKYGFPKPSCNEIHINSDGNIVLARGDNESRIIEYSPYFLIKWGGHCHINILIFEGHLVCSCNAIYYIVKYNFKHEPNLIVAVVDKNNSSFQTRFHARIVSVEEATTKIVSTDYYGSSMASTYVTIKCPEERKAAFKNGEQAQLTYVEKYFSRPPELERMGILSFFSYYNISPLSISNLQRIDQIIKQHGENSQTYLKPSRPLRPQYSLKKDSTWEQENLPSSQLIKTAILYPSQVLHNARALKINLRTKPQIVLTERFTCTSNIEEFAYVYIMLNGSWRSDEEMKAGQDTWVKALEYHGLTMPDSDGMLQYYQLLIDYMIKSPRYGTKDIIRNISMMNYEMINYLNQIKENVGNMEKSKIDDTINELNKLYQARSEEIIDINNFQNDDRLNQYINYTFSSEEINESNRKLTQEYFPKLNLEQKDIFDRIKTRIEGHQQVTAFIKGKAGTGKSFLIHTIVNFLIARETPFIVCASTGIAASLLKGKTVHSAFGLFSKKSGQPDEDVICSLDISKQNGYAMSKVRVIIVDEVTMMSGKVLGAMEHGLRKIMAQCRSPLQNTQFGGKSILLFGDLAQVPAVTRSFDDFLESLAQFHENESYEGFNKWKLGTIMRQSSDEIVLLKILDFIRNYRDGQSFDPEIESELQKLFIPGLIENVIDNLDEFVGHDDPNGMIITFTNKNAQLYNQLILEKRMKENNYNCINLQASFFVKEKTHFISNNNDSDQDSIGRQAALANVRIASEEEIRIFRGAMKKKVLNSIIPFSLNIIPKARIILLQNLDVNEGLINGARGTVINYIPEVDAINVKFDFQKEDDCPILITRRRSVEYQINNGKMMFMYMFPIKLSWAITSHKSQGQTLTKAVINIGEAAFAHGSFYVALSRVTSLQGLRLFGLENWPTGGPKIHMNPYIQSKEDDQVENEFY